MTRPLATLEDSTLLKLALAGQAECRYLVAVKGASVRSTPLTGRGGPPATSTGKFRSA
jgi:hypothetical protein